MFSAIVSDIGWKVYSWRGDFVSVSSYALHRCLRSLWETLLSSVWQKANLSLLFVMRNDICTYHFWKRLFSHMKLLTPFFFFLFFSRLWWWYFQQLNQTLGEEMFHGEAILCLSEVTVIVLCTDAVFDAALGNIFTLLSEKRRIWAFFYSS